MEANKKTEKKSKKEGFEFIIESKSVIDRENFGAFEVIKTKEGILYKNYTGYRVWTTPYAVGTDGKAHATSMYAWLDNLINTARAFKGKEKEPFFNEGDITKGDMLESEKIITEVNMTYPMTAFIDVDKATMFAKDYIEWLDSKQKELLKIANEQTSEEDVKANAEFDDKNSSIDPISEMIKGNNK